MIKLFVEQHGLFLEIPGMPAFRSPAEIDITKADVNLIISYLRQYGVNDYRIVSGIGQTIQTKEKSNIIEKPKNLDKVDKRLQTIEGLLKQFLERDYSIKDNIEISPKHDDIEEEFIPSIDIENLKVEGRIFSKQGEIDDISRNVDLLSKIEKKG